MRGKKCKLVIFAGTFELKDGSKQTVSELWCVNGDARTSSYSFTSHFKLDAG